jgi:hypothetical protein
MSEEQPILATERQGKTAMWLRLLWQMRELLPLLGKVLPLLEGWVAGNAGGAAATSRALAQLEARVGSTQDGLGGVEGQLRDHGTLLVHLSNELKHLRSQMDADRTDREAAAQQLAAEIASLRRGVLILTGLAGLVVVGVVWVILLLIPTHHP